MSQDMTQGAILSPVSAAGVSTTYANAVELKLYVITITHTAPIVRPVAILLPILQDMAIALLRKMV